MTRPEREKESKRTPAGLWRALVTYLGALGRRRETIVADLAGLEKFINTRSAHVAQTALYGYLRTRAGTRFPELFSDDRFVESINIAKWQVWLACVSDLAVHSGLMLRREGAAAPVVARLIQRVVESILTDTGVPQDAGTEFVAGVERVRSRILLCEWNIPDDDEAAFAQSPAALVQWAPVTDDLKELDEEIVINSVRFRWHEVRRDLKSGLRAESLLAEGCFTIHDKGSAHDAASR